jgi:hypothetical protein
MNTLLGTPGRRRGLFYIEHEPALHLWERFAELYGGGFYVKGAGPHPFPEPAALILELNTPVFRQDKLSPFGGSISEMYLHKPPGPHRYARAHRL